MNEQDLSKEKPSLVNHHYRIERIETHMKVQKENQELLKQIHASIVGNGMGDIGLAKKMEKAVNDIETLKDNNLTYNTYFTQMKWALGILTTFVLGIISALIIKFTK